MNIRLGGGGHARTAYVDYQTFFDIEVISS